MNADLAKRANPVLPDYRPTLRTKVDIVFHRVRAENTERWIPRKTGLIEVLECITNSHEFIGGASRGGRQNHVDDLLPTYMSFKMGRAAAVHNGARQAPH